MAGTGPTHGNGLRTPPKRYGSTRSGPRWGESTALMATGTWFAAVLQWRRTLNRTERTERTETAEKTEREFRLWVDEEARPGWANMAIDQTLLDRAEQLGERWLRLYRWRPFCLSFGRHEPATRRYDPVRIAALGIDTVRRPTGGRAVWHAQELTYAVAAPAAEFGFLRAAYLEIHCMLAQALGQIGVPAYLAPQAATPTLDAGACFTQAVGGEIMCSGRKLVGSAQLRMGNALLQHGSILLHDEQEVVRNVTTGAPPPRRAPSNTAPWARASDIAEAIAAQAQRRWSGSWKRITDHSAILSGAAAHHSRFQSSSWTWKR